MRYFFLVFALIVVLVVSFFGFRGEKFSSTPLRLFPDMDDQDKIKSQTPSDFFSDGMGARKPVAGTVPRGFADGSSYSYGNSTDYVHTGRFGDAYGDGMPKSIGFNVKTAAGILRHGKERYNISCMPCHGESGNGKGAAAVIGIPIVPSLMNFPKEKYPDGQMFETISNGKGQMGGYGYNIPINDRWAIIAYVRALQSANSTAAK